MRSAVGGLPWTFAAALLAGLILAASALAVPAAAGGAPPTSSAARADGIAADLSLPVSLAAPAAARFGYSAAYALHVPDAHPASGTMRLQLTFWPSDRAILDPGIAGASLTAGQFGARYGLDPATLAQVTGYLRAHGLSVAALSPDRLSLSVSGSAASVGAAFGTSVEAGSYSGHAVHFPDRAPTLPASWAGKVAAISGLSDGFTRFVPQSTVLAPAVAQRTDSSSPMRTAQYVSPTAPHVIYGLNDLYNYSGSPHWATGVGIALVLWGDGYDPADLQWFFQNEYPTGFPLPTLRAYPVAGAPAPSAQAVFDPSRAPQELTLDIEWAGSQAPGATLDAVYAPAGPASNGYSPSDADLEQAVQEAVNSIPGVQVLSMSFSTPDGSDPSFQAAMDVLLSEAAQRGITVLAASGDDGGSSAAACGGAPSPQYPAASPYALAVGGTAPVLALDALGQVTGLTSEPAWNRSGGGFAPEYPAPSWQASGIAAGPIASGGGHRGIPDVAGPSAANLFYFNGSPIAGQGTSFAAPMWGGLVAEMDAIRGAPLGELAPRLYAVAAAQASGKAAVGLGDITEGANCVAAATPGWDAATGLGSPRALALYSDLSGTFVNLSTTVSPQPVAPGGVLRVASTVLNATTARPIAGLTVSFALTAIGVSGPCGTGLPSGSAVTDASGRAEVQLTVPACYFASKIGVSVTLLSGGYFGNSAAVVSVNLLGLSGFLAEIQQFPYNILAFVLIMAIAIGLAYWLGRRPPSRRTVVPPPILPGASAAAGVRPPSPSPPPAPSPGPPPRSEPTAGGVPAGPTASAASAVQIPAHVLAPVPPPSACPICRTSVAPGVPNCPTCGHPMDPESADGGAATRTSGS